MSSVECKKQLYTFLTESQFIPCKIIVMPDLFLDRLINLDFGVAEFSRLIADVAKRKGGSIDGITQTDLRGGNAVNVASALVSLGIKVVPIVCTSPYGLQQIKYHFRDTPIDTSHFKTCGAASITTALEFKHQNEKTNVMLRDLGALANFGPSNLDDSDYALIDEAVYVCVFIWAGTLVHGTELAQAVFRRAKRGKAKTYYDTADPSPNTRGIAGLMEKVLKGDDLDVLALNENEAVAYASFLDEGLKLKKKSLNFTDLAMEAARILAKHLKARIDLHTTTFSATLRDQQEVVVPAFKVKTLRATGAGDAWTAGNLIGDANQLSDQCRLMLANVVSACYLSDADGLHPTRPKLAAFLGVNS